MYAYLYFGLISILICLSSAEDISDQSGLDDYNQAINSFDLSLNSSSPNQNVIDLLQSIQLNSTQPQSVKNTTGLNANLTNANIPTLFNSYQYDSPVYQEARNKEQSSSSGAQQLDSSATGTNQNYYAKEYAGFDDANQKLYIEQQIEQDSKYLPDVFDLPPPVPATQTIEQPISSNDNQHNVFDATKSNRIRPIQSPFKTPATASRLNKYTTKGTVTSIKMANNQEWNVIDKNQPAQQSAYIQVHPSHSLKSAGNSYYPIDSENSFTSLDQQVDLTKINKVKITGQPDYSRPIEGTQIITANNAPSVHPFQQQIISNYQSTRPQSIAQYGSPTLQQQITYQKKPCSKSHNYQGTRDRPFYFGWKQHQQRPYAGPQNQKVANAGNQATNYIQSQNYQASNYPTGNYQANNKYFGLPNQYDQQVKYDQFNKARKCCIIKFVPKPGFRPNQPVMSGSMMPYYNPLQQGNLNGMFGVGVGGFVNKLENKKSKIKNLIRAPFVFVNGMKHKALGQYRSPNFNPAQSTNYNPNYIQQQNTFTKSYSPEYSN